MAKIEEFKSRASALADEEVQDAFYRPVAAPKLRAKPAPRFVHEDMPREVLEETQEEDAFLRSRRRVPVRKGWLPRTRIGQFALAGGVLVGLAAVAAGAIGARELLKHDPRFRIDTSDSIQILGNSRVTRAELLSVFGSDIGRNVFFIPLAERRAGLERLPWVEHATVMRMLPNEIRVAVVERTPVAFIRSGNEIGLVDGNGVLLPMPSATADQSSPMHYSFPVVTGIDASDPLSTRAARMHIYRSFIDALDATGEKISAQLSEIDLSDPEDVKAVVEAPGGAPGSDLLLHFGDADFLARYRNYESHLAEWRQQYPRLASIDLRYERQVVLEMAKGAPGGSAASIPSGSTTSGSTTSGSTMPAVEEGGPAAASADTSSNHHAISGAPGKAAGKTPVNAKHLPVRHLAARAAKSNVKRAEYRDSYPVAASVPAPKAKPYLEAHPAARASATLPASENGAVQ